ncbi:hypothetical protein GCM10010483_65510 [Actinokineospora diospyrosa]
MTDPTTAYPLWTAAPAALLRPPSQPVDTRKLRRSRLDAVNLSAGDGSRSAASLQGHAFSPCFAVPPRLS